MNNKWKFRFVFFSVVLIQLIFLSGMIGMKSYTLSHGESILLKTSPIDPRSLFSGDYVILNYDISTIDLSTVETDIDLNELDRVYKSNRSPSANKLIRQAYVKLAKENDGRFYKVVSVTREKPAVKSGEVVIRAQDGSFWGWNQKSQIRLTYGIESYYIQEGSGAEFERDLRNRNVETYVEVSVDRFCNAGILGIFQNDKKIY